MSQIENHYRMPVVDTVLSVPGGGFLEIRKSGSTGFANTGLCPAGSYSLVGTGTTATCTDCGAGKWNGNTGQSACTSCAAGTESAALRATAIGTCTNCAVGTFSSSGKGFCSKCPVGTITASTGQSRCTQCASGTFVATVGQSACGGCAQNKYSTAAGAITACTDASSAGGTGTCAPTASASQSACISGSNKCGCSSGNCPIGGGTSDTTCQLACA